MLKSQLRMAFLGVVCLTSPAFGGVGDTFTPYVDYTFTHDNNLFRLANDAEALAVLGTTDKSDNIHRLKLGINVDYLLSRQRFVVDANISKNWFNRFSDLDFTGHELLARWDWQVGNQWSGDIGINTVTTLGSFIQLQQFVQNEISQDTFFVNGGYLFHPSWRVRGGFRGYDVEYDAQTQQLFNREDVTSLVGLQYLSRAGNLAELQLKYTDAEYPNRRQFLGPTIDDEYDQTELNALVEYAATVKTKFFGNLGYVQRDYNGTFVEDYDGLNGRLTMDWSPTAKTRLTASVFRELISIDDIASNYWLTTGVSIGPNWLPTTKIILQGLIYYENRDYRGTPASVLGGLPRQEDNVRGIAIGVTYDPLRFLKLGLGYVVESRNSNRALEDYSFNALTATVRAQF